MQAYYAAAGAVEAVLSAADQLAAAPSEESLKLLVDTLQVTHSFGIAFTCCFHWHRI